MEFDNSNSKDFYVGTTSRDGKFPRWPRSLHCFIGNNPDALAYYDFFRFTTTYTKQTLTSFAQSLYSHWNTRQKFVNLFLFDGWQIWFYNQNIIYKVIFCAPRIPQFQTQCNSKLSLIFWTSHKILILQVR